MIRLPEFSFARNLFSSRIFVTLSAAAVLSVSVLDANAQTRLRCMAANISSGNNQSYDPGEGTRIFKGLKPDIVMIQEFNYGDNSAATLSNYVTSTFGSTYTYARGPVAQIPNGVISRYPILASGSWTDPYVSNRSFVWAKIDVPGTKDLWAVSVHLLTADATTRNNEATSLKNFITSNVPAGDYLVIGGDFNTDSRTEACLGTLQAVVNTGSPYPADQGGNGNTNASRAKPYDWVLPDPDLDAIKTAVVIGSQSFTNGLVFDSRVYSPLSDVSPVVSTDSGAVNMQHMAVVRDFMLPASGGGGGGTVALTSGVSVNGSVAQGVWNYYSIAVPSTATSLQISMTGNNDADLYVRRGSLPTSTAYDFRPYISGSNESVTVNGTSSPALVPGSTYYIGVYGYSATASSYTLTATVTSGGGSTVRTVVDVSGVAVAQGSWKNYTVTVLSSDTKMVCTLSGSSGDGDMYVRKGSLPTLSAYDYRPYLSGSNESVTVTPTSSPMPLAAGTWYVSVYGYSAATFNLKVTLQ